MAKQRIPVPGPASFQVCPPGENLYQDILTGLRPGTGPGTDPGTDPGTGLGSGPGPGTSGTGRTVGPVLGPELVRTCGLAVLGPVLVGKSSTWRYAK